MPAVTVYNLGGNVVWGPQEVTPSMTVADIVRAVERPMHSPGLKILNGDELLTPEQYLCKLSDTTDLRVQFDPPKLFDHSFTNQLVELAIGACYKTHLEGECVDPSILVIPGAEVVRVENFECSSEALGWRVRLRLEAASQLIATKADQVLKLKLLDLKTSLGFGTLCETGLSDGLVPAEIVECTDEHVVVDAEFTMNFKEDELDELFEEDELWKIVDGPVQQLRSQHLSKIVHEGVNYQTGSLSKKMIDKLGTAIDHLKSSNAIDYHPGSNYIVRDLVHPSLFPFVEGISPTSDLSDVAPKSNKSEDKWGRPYETSNYQWLPSEVSVSADGKCTFDTYINNLDREKHGVLYSALEELLSHVLPLLESAWAHGNAVSALDKGEPDNCTDDPGAGDPEALDETSLRCRTIQVITKIADYEVPPHGAHEGVWHVEGMSHEHIIATAELILSKDDCLTGGDLEFQRSFTRSESKALVMGFPQCRPQSLDEIVEKGLVPLGYLPLPCGRIASWPNSHIHKVTPLKNNSNTTATRRILVFWLINPDIRIISTKHVAPQQGTMSLEDAHKYRLALMEERKRHKQNWNLREVTLCEH